jgi:tetratricopeptide (TPR) repeat protein
MSKSLAKGLLTLAAAQTLLFSPLAARPKLADAWQEYYKGAFQRASQKLSDFQRDTGTAESWYLAAKLEPEGERARENLEKALEDPARGEFFRRSLAELSLYFLATKNYAGVVQLKDRFPSFFEKKSFNPELACYLAKACRQMGRPEMGLKYSEEILNTYPSHPVAGWAALERGLVLLSGKKPEAGVEQLRRLVGKGGSEEVAVALLLLSQNLPGSKGRVYGQIYDDKFPHGLGRRSKAVGPAPPLFNSKKYRIEIGPFGGKGEAQRAFLKLKANFREAEITGRRLNDRTYYYIRWGEYATSREADEVRRELEKKLKASYSVVELE